MPTDTIALSEILNCSYYDRRTDYVWQYILTGQKERKRDYLLIPGLDSFLAMQEMLKCRKYDIPSFMAEWEANEQPGLLECSHNERSGIVRLKSRTFTFAYHSRTNEYRFTAYADVAKRCRLKNRVTRKKYARGGLFPIAYLTELDEQLYSRYDAALKLEAWLKSPQSKLDIEYCRQMVPTIMQKAETRKKQLHTGQQLNIILEGNDRVRIGLVEMYSPEEMWAMPSYPREEWRQGILTAYRQLEDRYLAEAEQHRTKMAQLSEELTQVVLKNTPIDTDHLLSHYDADVWKHVYAQTLLYDVVGNDRMAKKWEHQQELFQPFIAYLAGDSRSPRFTRFEAETFTYEADATGPEATITMKDEPLARMLGIDRVNKTVTPLSVRITPEMLSEYDDYIQQKYQETLTCQQRQQRPQHALMVEMLRHIIEVTAPLVAYAGTNETIRNEYRLRWDVTDDDRIMTQINFRDRAERQYFTSDDYKTRFRVWWSQLLLNECKLTKEASLNAEAQESQDAPF